MGSGLAGGRPPLSRRAKVVIGVLVAAGGGLDVLGAVANGAFVSDQTAVTSWSPGGPDIAGTVTMAPPPMRRYPRDHS
jgi:hypothetical protein